MIVALFCAVALLAFITGYVTAVARTPHLLARMTRDEARALGERVRTMRGAE